MTNIPFNEIEEIVGSELSIDYQSDDPFIFKKFLNTILSNSSKFDLRVAYFDSKWFYDHAKGIANFAKNNGKARWIISPKINHNDPLIDAVGSLELSEIQKLIEDDIELLIGSEENKKIITALAWLLKYKYLEIKIAVMKGKNFLHEKVGVFHDSNGDSLYYNSSGNLTGASTGQSNSTDIFFSIDDKRGKVQKKIKVFENIWNNNEPDIKVYNLNEEVIKKVLDFVGPDELESIDFDQLSFELDNLIIDELESTNFLDDDEIYDSIKIPKKFKNKKYDEVQEKAINFAREKNYSAILSMATGTGKTITTFKLLEDFINNSSSKFIYLFLSPLSLINQWHEKLFECGKPLINSFKNSDEKNRANLENDIKLFGNKPPKENQFYIAPHSMLRDKSLVNTLKDNANHLFIIVDEIHTFFNDNVLSKNIKEDFFDYLPLKIGLTATPEKRFKKLDENLDEINVSDFFGRDSLGDIVDISSAITKYKILCPYKYHIIDHHLTVDETLDLYNMWTEALRSLNIIKKPGLDGKNLDKEPRDSNNALLFKFYREFNGAKSKIDALSKLLNNNFCEELRSNNNSSIFFISSNHLEGLGDLIESKNLKISKIDQYVTIDDRALILDRLKDKKIDAVVAYTLLDEGIDIPSVNNAFFLESYREPRQAVQRRGRILRIDEENPEKMANLYDFRTIVHEDFLKIIPNSDIQSAKKFIKSMEEKERDRINIFSKDSINKNENLI